MAKIKWMDGDRRRVANLKKNILGNTKRFFLILFKDAKNKKNIFGGLQTVHPFYSGHKNKNLSLKNFLLLLFLSPLKKQF
jgi:hypothetical protein